MSSAEKKTSLDGPYESAFDVIEDKERSANLKLRSKAMNRLAEFVEHNGYSQEEAAEILNVSQSRVSRLLNGRISHFTIDSLVNMCHHAGIQVDLLFGDSEDAYSTAE